MQEKREGKEKGGHKDSGSQRKGKLESKERGKGTKGRKVGNKTGTDRG